MVGHRYVSKGLAAALLFACCIALLISLIPTFGVFDGVREIPAFKDQKNSYLTKYNIVDFVASFSTEMQIKKVTWEHDTLSIDFSIDNSNNLDTNIIYRDLYDFIKLGFIQTTNAKEILIRVFLDDNEIFVAISAKRGDLTSNPTMELEPSMVHKDFLNEYFGLNFGNKLKQE